jgi:peroxiredoxin Q/BCP
LEATRFRERIDEFQKKNVVVFGISTDPPGENAIFRKQENLPFPLLSDVDRKICLAYGACAFDNAYYANRITYIIDEQGLIQKVFPNVDPNTHASEILALL